MYIWWMLIPNITSFEGVFWPFKVHSPDIWGYANFYFPYISWNTGRILRPEKNIWPCNHAETFTFQTFCFSSISLVTCTQTFKALFATAWAEVLQRGTNLQQLNDSGCFSHMYVYSEFAICVSLCPWTIQRKKRFFIHLFEL